MEWEPDSVAISQEKTAIIEPSHPYNNEVTSVTSNRPDMDRIITFAYEDSYGNTKAIDITDFVDCQNPSKEFLLAIRNKLLLYNYSFAWGSKAVKYKNEKTGNLEGIYGDLVVLDTNFRLNDIESIIRYDKFTGIPYIKCSNSVSPIDIDLLQVFAKPLVKYVIFKNRYKSLHLHGVSTALLGYGKLCSGKDVMNLSVAERKAYCLQDAHIVADLVRVDNGDIMKIMQVISKHIGLTLYEVCHKGMTAIWNKILNDSISRRISLIGYDNIPSVLRKLYANNQSYIFYKNTNENFDSELEEGEDELEKDEKEQHYDEREDNFEQESTQYQNRKGGARNSPKQVFRKYKGAVVLAPKRGLHPDTHVFDVTSLYPTIIIKYNLSPETVNCSCCRDNSETLTPEILTDCRYAEDGYYWICQRKRGLFAKILEELTEERIRYKKSGLEVESQAIKTIINSGYGVFGHPYFKYYDPRVAELVTALGRYISTKMQEIANGLGFVTLYGDTDSLFVNNVKRREDVQKFTDECKLKLGVEVVREKTFSKLILVGKKHYVGILSDPSKDPIIKGMEGVKSDRPEFIHRVFVQLVHDIKNDTNPILKLNEAFQQLDCRQVPPDSLAISLVLRKNPEEYSQVCKQSRLGTKLGLRKGDTLVYYKCDTQQPVYDVKSKQNILRTVHESGTQDDISYAEYKKMLMNSVEDILEILGYDAEKELLGKKELINSIYLRRTN
jgi:hypothetical protein